MPRCVRNFWLDADVDGRRSRFATGPRARDGGFNLAIYHREAGHIAPHPLRIVGRCCNGRLSLTVEQGGDAVYVKEVER